MLLPKNQILSESNKNYKILLDIKERNTQEVSGHFKHIWPNFTSLTTKQELSAAPASETPNLRSEPMDDLKMHPKGSTTSSKSS